MIPVLKRERKNNFQIKIGGGGGGGGSVQRTMEGTPMSVCQNDEKTGSAGRTPKRKEKSDREATSQGGKTKKKQRTRAGSRETVNIRERVLMKSMSSSNKEGDWHRRKNRGGKGKKNSRRNWFLGPGLQREWG